MPFRTLTIGTNKTAHCSPIPRLLRPFTDPSGSPFVSVNIPVSLSSTDLRTLPARPWLRAGKPVLDSRTSEPVLIGPFHEIGELWIRDSVDEILLSTPHGPRRCTLTFRGTVGVRFSDNLDESALASHELDVEDASLNEPAFTPSTHNLAPDGRSTVVSNTANRSAFRNPNIEPSPRHSPSRSTLTHALSNTLAASTTPRADAFLASFNELTQSIDLRLDRGLITEPEWAAQLHTLVTRFNASTLPLRTTLSTELSSINHRLSTERLTARDSKLLEAKATELIDEISLLTFTAPSSAEALMASHSSSTPSESAGERSAPQTQTPTQEPLP